MLPFYLFFVLSIAFSSSQNPQNTNLPSVVLPEENLNNTIIEIFNNCKCVIFYKCDEENFIIPEDQLRSTKVTLNSSMRNVKRLRCLNEFYYCCMKKKEVSFISHDRDGCGDGNPSGEPTNEFPWAVAIYKKTPNGLVYKCGGSLIHPRVVLTEKECLNSMRNRDLGVVKGKDNLSVNPTVFTVKRIIRHPKDNVALLILLSGAKSKTICLPKYNQGFVGKKCIAIGWIPEEEKLKKIQLPILDPHRCENLLRNTSLGSDFRLKPSYLCTGGDKNEDTCVNDGGGPLMCEENGRYVQVGVVLRGFDCGMKSIPGLYINVANFAPWIKRWLPLKNF